MLTEETLFFALFGLVGLCVGSFLNVCIFRWPNDLSVVRPPSRCGDCGNEVRWYQNIPVISYVALRGRCGHCGTRLSPQYPAVELLVGLIWLGLAAQWGPSLEALRGALFLTILLGIALTDARYYIIPDEFSVGGTVLGLGMAFFPGGVTVRQSILGAALGFGLLWAIAILGKFAFKKDAMGGGDVKMMAMVGAFLGPAGTALTLFAGSLFGSIIFGPISYKTKKLVPFGIFLALGAGLTYAWGDLLIDWYVGDVLGL